jgi:hypothetical protein
VVVLKREKREERRRLEIYLDVLEGEGSKGKTKELRTVRALYIASFFPGVDRGGDRDEMK